MNHYCAWHKLNAQMKRSLKHYEEEAHVAKTKGDREEEIKWDERANALHILKDWFDILDGQIKETEDKG